MIPHTHRPDHNMWANEIDYNSMRPRRFCFGARLSRSARFSSRSVPRDAHHHPHTFPENDDDYDNSSTLLRDGTPGSSPCRLEPTRPPRRSPRTRSAPSGDDHLFHMLDFADLLDGVDVTDKRPSDARFRNPERTTTPKDFFFGFGFGFLFSFRGFGATGRETEPSLLTSPHRATTTFPPPHPPLTPFLSSRRRNAARLTRRRGGGDDACRRSTATFRKPRGTPLFAPFARARATSSSPRTSPRAD